MTTFPDWDAAKDHLCAVDPVLAPWIRRDPGACLTPRAQPFRTLVRSVVSQQLSIKAAQTIWDRFEALCGEISPEALLAQSVESIRATGLSGRKASYVQGIAQEPWRLEMQRYTTLTDEAAIQLLTEYRGVGVWTAQMFLMFTLCRGDVLPLGDVGLRRAVERHYAKGERLSDTEIENIAQPWQPWRTVATWYLWRSLDPLPVTY